PSGAGTTGGGAGGRATAWAYVPLRFNRHQDATTVAWRMPEPQAHCRGGLSPGPPDRLVHSFLFPVRSSRGRRTVQAMTEYALRLGGRPRVDRPPENIWRALP